MLNQSEIEKYSRQIILEDIGEEGQLKLKKAKVMVVGAGGLGCPVLQYLAAAGAGNIGIVDFDLVDGSNLHRQVLYNEEDIDKPKAEVAAERLRKQNSNIEIISYNEKLSKHNIDTLLNDFEIIVDCTDNFESRYLIDEVCTRTQKPMVYGSVHRYQGQVSVFNYYKKNLNPPTYRYLYPKPPEPGSGLDCSEGGVLGVLPGIIGTMQAAEVIKIITGAGEVLSGKLLCFDMRSMESVIIEIESNPENLKSHRYYDSHSESQMHVKEISAEELKGFISDNKDIQIIDIRENISNGISEIGFDNKNLDYVNIPRTELLQNPERLCRGKDVVIFCNSGNSSKRIIGTLMGKYELTNLYNLKGGIKEWKRINKNKS
jgi:molybdopterin/thiamine biosynthesis adenylyltransferase/rhodanese-related sulfurtransferase